MNGHRAGPWVLSLIIGAVVLLPSTTSQAVVTSATVREVGTSFAPKQLNVQIASATDEVEVVFSFVSSPSGSGHGVKFDDGTDLAKNCPALLLSNCQTSAGQTVSRRLSEGTYPYYCKIHGGPGGAGMAGVVVVSMAAKAPSTTTTRVSTNPSSKDSTTLTTSRAIASSTTTTRVLATSSTVLRSSTTTSDTSNALAPGAPLSFSDDTASGKSAGSHNRADTGTVALIVGLLLTVSAGGGYLLWRLRPGRG